MASLILNPLQLSLELNILLDYVYSTSITVRKSRIPTASAPVFRSSQRAEKRKEVVPLCIFYYMDFIFYIFISMTDQVKAYN